MPRKPCFWTRKFELQLVDFIKARPFIWKPVGNTNRQIQRKYKAFAEFAAKIGCGFTARSVRDRWVNIRSTFNHNVRRKEKSMSEPDSQTEVYVPCWPLWKPLQFLRNSAVQKHDDEDTAENSMLSIEAQHEGDIDPIAEFETNLTQRRTNKPTMQQTNEKQIKLQCIQVLNHLVLSMSGLNTASIDQKQIYWFFGKHVTQRLNGMSSVNAESAADAILSLLKEPTEILKTRGYT